MPRGVEKNQKMRDERRKQILSSALHLFAVKGLAATKITDIASRSGISQGLLYHYFRSKEAIFVELIRGAFEKMNTAARALENLPLTPKEKITKAIVDMLRITAENENFSLYFLLIAQASVSEAVPEEVKAIISKEDRVPYEVIARIMRAGQEDGSIRNYDPEQLSLVFWAMIKGIPIHCASHGPAFKAPDPRILAGTFFQEK